MGFPNYIYQYLIEDLKINCKSSSNQTTKKERTQQMKRNHNSIAQISMKVIMMLFMFIMCSNVEAAKKRVVISNTLIDSICKVESSNNANAIGDNGKAVGIAQIHKICVDDINRICKLKKNGLKFSYDDRKSVSKSKQMLKIYLQFYGDQYLRKTGKVPTNEILSRIWNGGPTGYNKKATIAYSMKVNRHLAFA